jgi:glutamate racemase
MKIGIFDSGIGGLSVLQEALKAFPGERYCYYADTEHVPYGNKPKAEVRGYAFAAMEFLAGRGCDAVVVACNTATSVAIDDLRGAFALPIIGMEPAVKPAVLSARRKRVLVLATEMTLREPKFHNLVARVDQDGIVDYLAMQELVGFAERLEFASEPLRAYLRARLEGRDLEAYGTVVLGCTHFLYFRSHLLKAFPAGTAVIDGNAGTVQRLANRVAGLPLEPEGNGGIEYFHSGRPAPPEAFERYRACLEPIPPATGS